MRILFSPIHYILDKHHSGSEFSWSYNLFDLLSKNTDIDSYFITGGTRGISLSRSNNIHDCKIIDPDKIDLGLLNVLRFYTSSSIATARYMMNNHVDILHHVLPFRIGYSFNLNGIITRKKFIVGPIQSSLTVHDTDLSVKDARGFQQSNRDVINIVGKKLIDTFQAGFGLLSHLTLRNASKIIVINDFTKKLLIKKGYSAKKIVIIPPGIDVHRFNGRLHPHKNHITCMTSTYLLKRKNVDILIHAVIEAHRIDPRIRLHIIGDGPQRKSLKDLVQSLGAEKYIFFKGFVDQNKIVEEYAQADIYLNASSSESFAASALEAIASKLPIVAARVGGYESVVHNGKNGYLVDKPTASNFAKKISLIASNLILREKMRKESYAQALSLYDWETIIVPQYVAVYKNLFSEI